MHLGFASSQSGTVASDCVGSILHLLHSKCFRFAQNLYVVLHETFSPVQLLLYVICGANAKFSKYILIMFVDGAGKIHFVQRVILKLFFWQNLIFQSIVMYPPPSIYTCTARIWLRELGFSLTYGALMLKTWRLVIQTFLPSKFSLTRKLNFARISVIFRVRSAKAVKITDAALLKRLGVICGCIGIGLLVRTIVAPPLVIVGRTADDLKAYLCKTDWWDHTFTSSEFRVFYYHRLRDTLTHNYKIKTFKNNNIS